MLNRKASVYLHATFHTQTVVHKPKIDYKNEETLYDLTKDEWNTLFPIELVDHNPEWKNIYDLEKERIISKVGSEKILRIEHFGSSSIQSIKSKPYIDLMIEIPKNFCLAKI